MASPLRPLAGLAAVLLLAGCGSARTSDGSSSGAGATSGGPAAALTTPLTVTRSGGIAGFQDRMVLAPDGVATLTRHSGPESRCRVQASLLETIARAAGAVDWASLPATQTRARHPDELVVTVFSGRVSARLDDPAVRELAQPLTDLLDDATAPPEQRRLCTPL